VGYLQRKKEFARLSYFHCANGALDIIEYDKTIGLVQG
jgi:hypothetical protein